MRTAGDMPLAGQHGQERLNVGGSHVPGVAHGATCPCRPAHEKAHPVDVGFFGVETIVAVTQALPQLIQQAGGMQDRSGGFHGEFIPVFLHSVWPGEASCTRLSAVSVVGCIRLRQFYPAGFAGYITLGTKLEARLKITERKYCSYYFALKSVYVLHKEYAFGKSPDIPSGFSESLCKSLLRLNNGSDRTYDAIDMCGNRVEIKATGSVEGKTTINNSNEFESLIWLFIEFDTDSVHLYKLPRSVFELTGGNKRSSISLKSIVNKNNINSEIYTFTLQTQED